MEGQQCPGKDGQDGARRLVGTTSSKYKKTVAKGRGVVYAAHLDGDREKLGVGDKAKRLG